MSPFSIALDSKRKAAEKNSHLFKFLREHPAGVLASVDPDGNPHATVIYYSIDPNFAIKFLTKRGTKKSSNLQYNDRVALVVFDDISQTTAQLIGTVEELADPEEINKVFRNTLRTSLRTSRNGVPPIAKLQAGDYIAYRMKPVEIRMADFAKPRTGNHEQIFEITELY